MDMATYVYAISNHLPEDEKFGLKSQMCRCVVSIVSNIAEGSGRETRRDFAYFLTVAFASCYELETQLILTERLAYLNPQAVASLQIKLTELQKMIYSFRESIREK